MANNPFSDALYELNGPCRVTHINPTSTIASASGEGTLSGSGQIVPGLFYGFTVQNQTANNTMDFRLIDASATSVNTPVLFYINKLNAATNTHTFPRPIRFDKGLQYLACATGASSVQFQFYWNPVGRYVAS